MIRILTISRINLSSGRTHVYNLTKTTEALNNCENVDVDLVSTDKNHDLDVFFNKFNVQNKFDLFLLNSFSNKLINKNRFLGWIAIFVANFSIIKFILKNRKKYNLIYLRDETLFLSVIFCKIFLRKKVFFEVHSVLERAHGQMMNLIIARLADGIIAISSGLEKYYRKFNSNILMALCSSYEKSWFDYEKSKDDFRNELRLPTDKILIGYTGVMGANPNNDYYEIDDVVKSLKKLPENVVFVGIGEMNNNADWIRKIAKENFLEERVILMPWQDREIIPKFLQSFDILAIPKRKKDLIGDSPAKIFPSLASLVPIVAGRSESISDILIDGSNAVIVDENNEEGWFKAIKSLLDNKNLSDKIRKQAFEDKDKYTWEKRAEKIMEFI
jgi:glycosyltransferase involved in cell wall biosynthesis